MAFLSFGRYLAMGSPDGTPFHVFTSAVVLRLPISHCLPAVVRQPSNCYLEISKFAIADSLELAACITCPLPCSPKPCRGFPKVFHTVCCRPCTGEVRHCGPRRMCCGNGNRWERTDVANFLCRLDPICSDPMIFNPPIRDFQKLERNGMEQK